MTKLLCIYIYKENLIHITDQFIACMYGGYTQSVQGAVKTKLFSSYQK